MVRLVANTSGSEEPVREVGLAKFGKESVKALEKKSEMLR